VEDATLVGVMDGPRDIGHELCHPPGVLPEAGQLLGEAAPFNQFHAEVMLPVMLTDLIDGYYVRVVKIGRRLGFAPKAPHVGRGRQLAGEDHLEGDHALELDLPGLVNHAHATAGNLLQQLVVAERADFPQRAGRSSRAGRKRRRVSRHLGARGGRGPQRPGQVLKSLTVGQEGFQLRGDVCVLGQELLAVRRPARVGCL
jgi:hypothetical protein